MSTRCLGGMISPTAVSPTTASAPGVWTLEQARYYITQNSWPISDLHWMSGLSASSLSLWGIDIDSYGNAYVTGTLGTSSLCLFIAKLNQGGVLQWIKQLGVSNTSGYAYSGYGVKVYGANIVVSGSNSNAPYPYSGGQVAVYNTNGVLQSQKVFNGTSSESTYFNSCFADASNNTYFIGNVNSSGSSRMYTVKCDSSGAVLWQKLLTWGSGTVGISRGITVDSSGNVYCTGYYSTSGGTGPDMLIAKYNSSGVLQWQKSIANTTAGSNDGLYSVALDSSDNIYVAGYTDISSGGGNRSLFIAKFNPSGTIQWQRIVALASGSYASVRLDSADNVYVSAYGVICKYNSSGTIQWQRSIAGVSFRSIACTTNNIYCVGDQLTVKLSTDGSGTGTYTVNGTSYTYAVSTYSEYAGSLIVSSGGLSDSSATFTPATTYLCESTPTVTAGTTIVP